MSFCLLLSLGLQAAAAEVESDATCPSGSTACASQEASTDVSGLLQTKIMKDIDDSEKQIAGVRCYNWPKCNSPSCSRISKPATLASLQAQCDADSCCNWVSCHVDDNDASICKRHMLSSSCDVSTRDPENGWVIHEPATAGQVRCFNWPKCNSPSCSRISKPATLASLQSQCKAQADCNWVSCHADENSPGTCKRYMLSSSCDAATRDPDNGWSIHKQAC